MPTTPETRTIKVGALTRVEGEGALLVRIRGDTVAKLELRIYEPPRFFEALLRGRPFSDAPDITARICGICPLAYITSACQAMEDALGAPVEGALRDLRRLAYCGEWIESHVLHVAMLHAPDFLGVPDAFAIAETDPDLVKTALRLKRLGNRILEVVGGRAVHPVNFRVGGFYKVPNRDAVKALAEPLRWGIEAAVGMTAAVAAFDFPDLDVAATLVALREDGAYPIDRGRIVSDRGLDVPVADFGRHFGEEHVARSNALHGMTAAGEPYLTGPLARYTLNHDRLSPLARQAAAEAGLGPECRNPFRSIIVRMVEVIYACEEALRLVEAYTPPEAPAVPVVAGAGEGHGASEAPRGLLYHHYRLDGEGRITFADIVPPTAQNQKQMEADLRAVVEANLGADDATLRWRCEQAIRNYDPCISCATHFLDVRVERG
ncbi:MAG: Ni/Fe hydrogenase subunit alpha [Rhodospirillales bacterium]|nr:MAG: Ni/Fe hydrogenase subunit alpha [Rhodospirillales bacterium]